MSDTPLGYYKWFPRDFLSSRTVRRMSITAQGVYRTLLDLQWEDGDVPTDPEEAKEVIGATDEEWATFERFFEACFPDGKNPVLDDQRVSSCAAIEAQREAGRKGGMKSGKGRVEPKQEDILGDTKGTLEGTPKGSPEVPLTQQQQKQKQKQEEPPKPPKGENGPAKPSPFDGWKGLDGFKELRQAWPRYQAHRKALKIKPYTDVGIQGLATKIEKASPPGMCCHVLTACIERTIASNWQGIPDSVIGDVAGKIGIETSEKTQVVTYQDDGNGNLVPKVMTA